MKLRYDPAENTTFWENIRKIPGFPLQDEIPLRLMLFECGALYNLPSVLERFTTCATKKTLVVMDNTPMRRGTDSLKPLLIQVLNGSGWETEALVLQPDSSGQVHTDMSQINTVISHIKSDQAVISLGSGVITDITKHACYLYQQESGQPLVYVSYQTANSVSAYTSSMAPVFLDGVKRTLNSRYPDALVCDLETLCDAPYDMTAAGVGDLLAVFSALADWNLACRLGMDCSCTDLPRTLMGPLDEILLAYAPAIRERTPAGMEMLAKLIALGGLAMSLSHATTPLSGYEHVISHILDLLSELKSTPMAPHGLQVAISSILALGSYRSFLEDFQPTNIDLDTVFPSSDKMQEQILRQFSRVDGSGKAGRECWLDYSIKLENWHANRSEVVAFLKDWDIVKQELENLLCPPERLVNILRSVHAPLTFQELEPPASEADVHFAFMNAPLMRKRLTLGDLLIFFGWEREKLWGRLWHFMQAQAAQLR